MRSPLRKDWSLAAPLVVVGTVIWSCAAPEASLGESSGNPLPGFGIDAGDAEVGEGGPAELTLACVATDCPSPYTTCPAEYGPTYKCAVDLRSDQKHCGACGNECLSFLPLNMTSRCVEGRCELACVSLPRPTPEGYVDTDFRNCNTKVDDGCEADLRADAANCGACGHVCAAGERCHDGVCGCPAGQTDCSGRCVDLKSNDKHCSACDNACQVPAAPCTPMPANTEYGCANGECGKLKCQFGFSDCNGDLMLGCGSDGCETSADENNCGSCGKKCQPGEECRTEVDGTSCRVPCEKLGKVECVFIGCVDIQTDPSHCGGCGHACEGTGKRRVGSCQKGVCVLACADGFADCNGDPTDGCEVDVTRNPLHCGACAASCDMAAGQPCIEGKCLVEPCPGGVPQ